MFVSKKDRRSTLEEFRPISVTSVVVRQLHEVYAARLMRANVTDERQRGLCESCDVTLQRLGLPKAFVEYIKTVYRSSKTVLVSCLNESR